MTPSRLAWAGAALLALGCRHREEPRPTPAPTAAAKVSCTPRTAEKLGIPFVRVCPPGEPGFWINAAPMGCSAGEHEGIRCPPTTPIGHPVGTGGPLHSSLAAVTDHDTAARLCYFRMGGHVASRAERSKARAAGLATVLVTESDASPVRFRLEEAPEWVTEEGGEACENGLPSATCHFGWFPSTSRSTAIRWPQVRACDARFVAPPPADTALAPLGSGCAAATWTWPPDGGSVALPCALKSPARNDRGEPVSAAFTFSCVAPVARTHPEGQDVDTAAYRCVLPESALGTFDPDGG